MGRKRKGSVLHVVIPDTQKNIIQQRAEYLDMSISDYARQVIRCGLEHMPEVVNKEKGKPLVEVFAAEMDKDDYKYNPVYIRQLKITCSQCNKLLFEDAEIFKVNDKCLCEKCFITYKENKKYKNDKQ